MDESRINRKTKIKEEKEIELNKEKKEQKEQKEKREGEKRILETTCLLFRGSIALKKDCCSFQAPLPRQMPFTTVNRTSRIESLSTKPKL
jgi:hypothetical protein